ncbi:hypothetical protein [Glaciibacter superstes]|uniref:hypothetical protein n=1 Tax=Glaciibacter superstes TaxID=501023 RepID=UPI0003B4296C|nr:hypothetical protein [Glaciibacter superstes]
MIEPNEITGVDENTALRVIAYAISIAPYLDGLEDGRNRWSAIAILIGVGREVVARGSRLVKAQRIGSASVDYTVVASCFSEDDRGALRALCGSSTVTGGPIGKFPRATKTFSRIWPEENEGE